MYDSNGNSARTVLLCLVAQSCLTLCDPIDCSPPGSSVHGILQARTLEWGAMPSSRGSSQPRDQTQVTHTAGGFFTDWAMREAQEVDWEILSLLQTIFPTQESNRGLLHYRQILYQLSYQGSWQMILVRTYKLSLSLSIYIYIYIHKYTYTFHTYIHIYMCVCVCIYIYETCCFLVAPHGL